MNKKGQIKYINIQGFMIYDLGLNGNELLLYAMIYGYTQDGKNTYHGSLNYIAQGLNISRRSAINLLQKLQNKGLIIKTKESHYIAVEGKNCTGEKSSQDWGKNCTTNGEKSSLVGGEKSSLNNNKEIIIKNNNKIIKEKTSFSLLLKKEILENFEFIEKLKQKFDFLDKKAFQENLENFSLYWTEKNPNGKKERWEMQKTFDIKRRFYTWLQNSQKFSKKPGKTKNIGITAI